MREIKFRAWDKDIHKYVLQEEIRKGHYLQHYITVYPNKYKCNGYVMRKVLNHPYSNSRNYISEHRLIIEIELGRPLVPRKELVHHLDKVRDNNVLSNLKLSNPKDHAKGHIGQRNENGRFTCISKEFEDHMYRLFDKDRNITQIYTLNELISKTFRRGKFEYRGRNTGLKDKNGKEIFEGDILKASESIIKIEFSGRGWQGRYLNKSQKYEIPIKNNNYLHWEIIGNIYEDENLLK